MFALIIVSDVVCGLHAISCLLFTVTVYEYMYKRNDQPDFLEEFEEQCINDEKVMCLSTLCVFVCVYVCVRVCVMCVRALCVYGMLCVYGVLCVY